MFDTVFIFLPFFIFFCSYDARAGGGDSAERWSDPRAGFGFGDRAHFHVSSSSGSGPGRRPGRARLSVQDLQRGEGGVYRCRVDFKTAPTRNSLVNLTVIGECTTNITTCVRKARAHTYL